MALVARVKVCHSQLGLLVTMELGTEERVCEGLDHRLGCVYEGGRGEIQKNVGRGFEGTWGSCDRPKSKD